ncbi:MAG: signal peptidase I [Hyphomonadaceae bacterium]|jgi:signal peptidase I|nr:signal peptidase I [Aquidulcibacter sp.]
MEETIELEKRGFLRRVGIGLLNLFTPGLGLVRLGQYQLGFAVMAVSLAIVPVTFFLCSRLPSQTFSTLIPIFLIPTTVVLVCIITSFVMVWRRSGRLQARQGVLWRWYGVLGIWVLTSGINFDFTERVKRELYRTFSIPSEGMDPTLRLGDRLVAKLGDSEPISRGDVLIFVLSGEDLNKSANISRVAAIPGDTFSMKDGVVSINRKPVILERLSDVDRDAFGQKRPIKRFREQFLGEASSHEILEIEESPYDDFAEVKLGEDQYFLLGDNRDNSTDSRMGKDMSGPGIVNRSQIKGRALFRYWRPGLGLQEGKL